MSNVRPMHLLLRTFSTFAALAVAGCSSTNALWNDSGSSKTIGFWLYNTTGSCPSIRKNPPIVFAPKYDLAGTNAKEVNVKDLKYCFELLPKAPKGRSNSCESGNISYTYLPEQNKYLGSYKLKLSNGKVLEGNFLAEYCPKSDSQ